jgi:hypothetical protein
LITHFLILRVIDMERLRYSTAVGGLCPKCGEPSPYIACPKCLHSQDAYTASFWNWFKARRDDLAELVDEPHAAYMLAKLRYSSRVMTAGSNFIGLASRREALEFIRGLPDYSYVWEKRTQSQPCPCDMIAKSPAGSFLVFPASLRPMQASGLILYDSFTFIKILRSFIKASICAGFDREIGDLFVFDRPYAAAAVQAAAADAGLGALSMVIPSNWKGYTPNPFLALSESKIGRIIVCASSPVCSGAYGLEASAHYRALNISKGYEWSKVDAERLVNLHPGEVVAVENPKSKVAGNVRPESKGYTKRSFMRKQERRKFGF